MDRAVKLVTIQREIHKTSGLLKPFLFEVYGTCLKMRCEGMTIKRQAVPTKREEVAISRKAVKKRERTQSWGRGRWGPRRSPSS